MPCGPSYQSRWSSATLSTAALSARHRVGVVELEARQLHGEHVVRRRVHHRLDDREADVADRDAAQAGRAQDRVEHLHGRGLAVRAGDREPRRGVLGSRAAARPARPRPRPGCPGLGPARSAGADGFQPGETTSRSASSGSSAVVPGPEPDVGAEHPEQLGLAPPCRRADSSSATTDAPRWVRLSAAAKPLTPNPATTARTPDQSSWRPRLQSTAPRDLSGSPRRCR